MANIKTGDVETYVKGLISEEFGHGVNRNNHKQTQIYTDSKADPKLSRSILDGWLEPGEKEA